MKTVLFFRSPRNIHESTNPKQVQVVLMLLMVSNDSLPDVASGQPQPAHGPMTGFGQVVRGPVCDCFGVRLMDIKPLINMLINA